MTEPTMSQRDMDVARDWLKDCSDHRGEQILSLAELLARTRVEAEAAILLAAAARRCEWCARGWDFDAALTDMHRNAYGSIFHICDALDIRKLQSSGAAAALARRDAETRLDEAKRWRDRYDDHSMEAQERIAELEKQCREAKK